MKFLLFLLLFFQIGSLRAFDVKNYTSPSIYSFRVNQDYYIVKGKNLSKATKVGFKVKVISLYTNHSSNKSPAICIV